MSVDTGITCSAAKSLAGNHSVVLSRLRVAVVLAQTEVDHEQPVTGLSVSHDEVIRLDVTMNDVPRVNHFELAELERHSQTRPSQMRDNKEDRTLYHLICQHQNSLQAELPATLSE